MWRFRRGYLIIMLAGVLLGSLPQMLMGQHGHWIDKYKSASGIACCSIRDCHPTYARLLAREGAYTRVEIAGEMVLLPTSQVFLSEDRSDWVCYTLDHQVRCLFLAVGA